MGMLNPAPELSLDFKPTFIPKTISQFLGEVARIGSVCEKILKVDDFVGRLEIEIRKIDAFKRELPLCMLLMNDAIVALKEELTIFKKSANPPTLEEFIPLNKTCDEDPKPETDNGDKKNWLSSTQLWNTNDNNSDTNQNPIPKQNSVKQVIQKRVNEEQDGIIESPFSGKSRTEVIPFKGFFTRNEDKEESPIPVLSPITPGIKIPMRVNGGNAIQSNVKIGTSQLQPLNQQTSRKQRRCWSTELHRRFLNALQQLGGSKVATPKQIRELMRVDGLTNDEVKSHLQKYRLHTRRLPSLNASSTIPLWTQDQYVESSKYKDFHQSESGSPDGPLNFTTAGTSTTGGTTSTTGGGDSLDDEEDEKSENNCWKSHLLISGKDNV